MRSRILIPLLVVLILGQSVFYIAHRTFSPTDGLRFYLTPGEVRSDGILFTPISPGTGELQAGDVVTAIDGVPIEDLVKFALTGSWRAPRVLGPNLELSVRRGGQILTITQPLTRIPLATTLAVNWQNTAILYTFLLIALFLYIKKPDEPAARVLLVIAAVQASTNWEWGVQSVDFITRIPLIQYILSTGLIFSMIWASYLHFSLTFPRPKKKILEIPWLTPAIYGFPILITSLWWLLGWIFEKSWLPWLSGLTRPLYAIAGINMALTFLVVIHTFRTEQDPVGRAQIRWVMFAFGIALSVSAVFGIIPNVISQGVFTPNKMTLIFVEGSFLFIPTAIVISILRYRLFDIDLIIRRTLQYAILTGVLALIYFVDIILLQSGVAALTGESRSPIVVVLTTLAIAALFNPLRTRIQAFIDRRFYRNKYNAEQTLARFSIAAREDVDLESLEESILNVIEETMQPETALLLIRG